MNNRFEIIFNEFTKNYVIIDKSKPETKYGKVVKNENNEIIYKQICFSNNKENIEMVCRTLNYSNIEFY